MNTLRLYKREKLCSVTAIDRLFARSEGAHSFICYPLRVVWRNAVERQGGGTQFMITVPKKRLRHAVDRVAMRRRIREAYRLHRAVAPAMTAGRVDIAFVYVGDNLQPYQRIESAMIKALSRMESAFNTATDDTPASE